MAASSAGLNVVESGRRIMVDSGSSSSNKRFSSPRTSAQDWCPVLPAARDVLPAALVHTQGVGKAVEWLQQQVPRGTMGREQQQGKGKNKGVAADRGTSPDRLKPHPVSVTTVNNFLAAAAAESVREAEDSNDISTAAAIVKEAVEAANELFNYPLAAAQLVAGGDNKQGGGGSSGFLLPNATSYSLLISLHGAAGDLQCVVDLVMAAVRGQLPLGGQQQQHEVWSPPAVEVLLSAAADVWLAAGAPDVAVSLLDGLLVAGGRDITQPTLALAMLDAADEGEEQVRE